MAEEKTIYDLDLHEFLSIDNANCIMRVPGGWIYLSLVLPSEGSSFGVFVPFNNEFMADKPKE